MARGKKLDLDIGAKMDASWCDVRKADEIEHTTVLQAPQQHALVFQRQKRRGKTVTLVGPFHRDKTEALTLLKTVKKRLGCGGSYHAPWMEFQGELQTSLKPLFQDEGFRFKH